VLETGIGALVCAGLLVSSVQAFAQERFPARPVRLIVPFPPGGGTDLIARLTARLMTQGLGQQVIVDNRGGAGGMIGIEAGVRANADGHTLRLVSASYTAMPSLYKIAFDPLKDVAPVSMVATGPSIVAVHPSLPVKNVKELIAYAKANPGRINYGSGGQGTHTHLVIELFRLMAGVEMKHIPYKGSGPAVTDLIGGQIQLTFGAAVSMLPHVKAGRVQGLAVTSAKRSPIAPELPTIAESGLAGYEAMSWYGILAPAKTPEAILARLNDEVKRIAPDREVQERLAREGFESVYMSRAEFSGKIESDIGKWRKVVKAANVTLQ
jgi:tripartite-type tricarboxylate transporter receptor subunit TctC